MMGVPSFFESPRAFRKGGTPDFEVFSGQPSGKGLVSKTDLVGFNPLAARGAIGTLESPAVLKTVKPRKGFSKSTLLAPLFKDPSPEPAPDQFKPGEGVTFTGE